MPKAERPILIVEDNPEDYEATARTFRKLGITRPVFRCEDGDEALDYLFQRGTFSEGGNAPRPGLILLDLNLPGTDGRQVLNEIKQDPALRSIPVLVFTTSNHEDDVRACYHAGASSYILKPVDLKGFNNALQRVTEYWFGTVLLPQIS